MTSKKELLDHVLQEVRQQMQYTILSYPERDPSKNYKWGEPGYNGNCTGKIPLGFIDKLQAKSVAELYAGSGTTSDVCRDYNIPYCGVDLNPNPVREDIISMDILNYDMELPDFFHSADMIFQHPPYPGLNHVKYCGKAWKDTVGGLAERDIQNMDFATGMAKINQATMRAYSAMQSGAYMVILVGEIRANGKYYSMMQNLALPGEFFQSYVKLQHNTWSDRQNYGKSTNSRALTGHEMIAVIKKPSGYEIAFIMPQKYVTDIRDSMKATWKDICLTYAREAKTFTNKEICEDLKHHKKGENNQNVDAKIRQTLARLAEIGLINHIAPATWAVA